MSIVKYILFLILLLYLNYSNANTYQKHRSNSPNFYAGLAIGYGETTWSNLSTNDPLVLVSAPKESHDVGTTWGGFLGYQFGKSFALEATYMRYPNTRVILDEFTFYYPTTQFTTHTQAYSLIGKFILPLANSRINAYLDVGAGFTHRNDSFAKVTRAGPTFGLGFMSNASPNIIAEIGFEYYSGYGRSEHRPIDNFVPFLFSLYFRLGYRFL